MKPIDDFLHALTFPMIPLYAEIFRAGGRHTTRVLAVLAIYSVLVLIGAGTIILELLNILGL